MDYHLLHWNDMDKIKFRGIDYPIRIVDAEDEFGGVQEVFAGPSLYNKLYEMTDGWDLDKKSNVDSQEAFTIDSHITFYVDNDDILTNASDEELLNLIL